MNLVCRDVCLEETLACISSCLNDNACISQCARDETICLQRKYFIRDLRTKNFILDCPCDTECPHGCFGCSNTICAECADKENNQNWYRCIQKYGADLGFCIYYCSDDGCIDSCVADYQNQILNCPCEV